MTNEQYLIVSYFAAAGGGVVMAVITAMILRSPLRQAVGGILSPLGRLLRRLLPAWLILFVLFAFMTVSYFDCSHQTYQKIVTDRPHMIRVTHSQAQHMLLFAGVALFVYVLGLAVILVVRPRTVEGHGRLSDHTGDGGFR